MVKQLNARFDDETFEDLKEVKAGRTWEDAIIEEFGVDDD